MTYPKYLGTEDVPKCLNYFNTLDGIEYRYLVGTGNILKVSKRVLSI